MPKKNTSAWDNNADNAVPPRPANYSASEGTTSNESAYAAPKPVTGNAFTPSPGKSQKEIELEQREAALFVRERQLAEREKNMADYHPPNWPWFRPLVYHDIEADIPQKGQYIVKRLYAVSVAAMLMNCIASLGLLTIKADWAGNNFGISLAVLVFGTPVSFVFWYQAIYQGVKRNRSISFVLFFFNYFIHLAAMCLFSVGIPGWGGAGVIYAISSLNQNGGVGALCVISSAMLIFDVIYGIWQMKAVHGYWCTSGLSTDKAIAEGNTEMTRIGVTVVKNNAVNAVVTGDR